MTTVTDSDSKVSIAIKDQEAASPPIKRAAAQKINAPFLYQHAGGIQSRARAHDRQRLAGAAYVRFTEAVEFSSAAALPFYRAQVARKIFRRYVRLAPANCTIHRDTAVVVESRMGAVT
jgi:hypothetical protein